MTQKIIFCLPFLWFSCVQSDCPKNINKLPMYGHVKKCNSQLYSDSQFLESCDKEFKSRQDAANYYLSRGWDYFYKNEFDTAMMRFNQSWLLDSLNADIYWGYGNILGLKDKKYKESIIYFEKSLEMDSSNFRVWEGASTSYGQLFYETKDINLLNKSIDYLKTSIKLQPNNVRAYGQLTAAYSYFNKKDSARKYLNITDRLDSTAINPDVRRILSSE